MLLDDAAGIPRDNAKLYARMGVEIEPVSSAVRSR